MSQGRASRLVVDKQTTPSPPGAHIEPRCESCARLTVSSMQPNLWDAPGHEMDKAGAVIHRMLNQIELGELSTIGDVEMEKVEGT